MGLTTGSGDLRPEGASMTTDLHRAALRVLFVSISALCAVSVFVCPILTVTDLLDRVCVCALVLVGDICSIPRTDPLKRASLTSVVLMSVYVIADPAAAVVVAGVACTGAGRRKCPLIKRDFNVRHRHPCRPLVVRWSTTLSEGPIGSDVFCDVPRALILAVHGDAGSAHQVVNAAADVPRALAGARAGGRRLASSARSSLPTAPADARLRLPRPPAGRGLARVVSGSLAGLLILVPLIVRSLGAVTGRGGDEPHRRRRCVPSSR